MADKFTMSTGQAHELAMAFDRNGWNNADVKKLSEGDMLARLLPLIRNQSSTPALFPALINASDLIPEYTDRAGKKRKWEVIEDVEPSGLDITKLVPRSFLRNGESYISGEEMRRRAIELKGNLGLSDGKRLLDERDKIPPEFRNYYIALPGTVLRGSGGDLGVPFLGWGGGRWLLGFGWLGCGWGGRARLACGE